MKGALRGLALTLLLLACGGGGGEGSVATDGAQQEAAYLEVLHEGLPPYPPVQLGVSDEQLVDIGRQQCDKLSEEWTVENLSKAMLNANANPSDSVAVPGAAVQELCPEHMEKWRAFEDELLGGG